jgi:REP element-mobilizing transposase RayT
VRQESFGFFRDFKSEFGGSFILGKRKTARPLSVKNPIHLILKSTGASCFVPGNRKLENLIRSHAEKCGIKIYRLSPNWSHIHMVIKLPSKKAYLDFIRTITACLVRFLSKIKGKNLKGLFDLRPFTRILNGGKDFWNVVHYHIKNDMEARGLDGNKKKPSRDKKSSTSQSKSKTRESS